MKTEVQKVSDELNDHFDTTVRKLLSIPEEADVTENEETPRS